MKIPKKTKRYCRSCKKHTEHKVSMVSSGRQRGSLKRGSAGRAKKRGLARGKGSHGKWPPSKPASSKWKRRTKSTKKTNLMYTCQICKKSSIQRQGIRTGRLMFKEK